MRVFIENISNVMNQIRKNKKQKSQQFICQSVIKCDFFLKVTFAKMMDNIFFYNLLFLSKNIFNLI